MLLSLQGCQEIFMSPRVGQAPFSAATIQSFQIKYCPINTCFNTYVFSHPTVMVTEDFS